MSISFAEVRIVTVLVAAIATFMVGGIWYGAIFGKRWGQVHGFTADQLAEMQKKQLRNFAIFFVGDLVMATVLSLLVAALGVTTVAGGAGLGFLLWLGVAATIGASKNAANNKPLEAYLIDTGHELACLVVMGGIVGAWR